MELGRKISSPPLMLHEERDNYVGNNGENEGFNELQFENFLSKIVAAQDLDDDFDDPDYNLEEDDDDYHDVIADQHGMKAKGRPKKSGNNEDGPSDVGILIPNATKDVDSDYDESDELLEGGTDSENEKGEIYEEYLEEKHKKNPRLELGMKFGSFKEFKDACKNWGIKNRRQLVFPTNDKRRCICMCKQKGCSFRIYASPVSRFDPTIQIKRLDPKHTGPNVFDNFHMAPHWIAKRYYNIFRADPDWNVSGLIETLKNDYNYTISRDKAWKAKRQALKWVYGEEGAQYGKLLRYRADLMNTNPGSNVVIWRDRGKCMGFYVCLSPLKEGFKSGCRPLISLDGCWLKGTYGGNLLAAVAIDPNDCIFPVAYAVITEAESKETWSWFLTNLADDLEIRNSHHIAFMSDRQKGLIGAVKDLFPEAEHRNCVRHMYQNFRQKHKGKALKDLVWNAARASNVVTFNRCMERLEQEDIEARKWFDHPERSFHSWTRALFKINSKCDMLLNNLCESFNRYILDSRDKAIITMLEMIKNKLMKRLYKKKQWIGKYEGVICPKVEKKLNKIGKEAVLFTPDYSGGPKVSVDGPGGPYIVDMLRKSCTCRRWDLTGLPCPHAMISIHGNNEKVEDYVHDYYKIETFKNVYSHFINPTNPEDHWPEVVNGGEVLPPKVVKKKRGRKPKARRKEAEELEKNKQDEAQRIADRRSEKRGEEEAPKKLSKKGLVHIRCSICKNYGHNARGHNKFINTPMSRVGPTSESQQSVDDYGVANDEGTWENSDQFNHDISDNSQIEVNLTSHSFISQVMFSTT